MIIDDERASSPIQRMMDEGFREKLSSFLRFFEAFFVIQHKYSRAVVKGCTWNRFDIPHE